MPKLKLFKDDAILTAYAERASGPGWANRPVWAIVRGIDGKIRQECIQPEEMPHDMNLLYNLSEAAHLAMLNATESAVRRVKRAEVNP